MKILASLFVLLASSAALAFPAVGDYAMMTGTVTMSQMTSNISLERSISGFDAITNTFAVVETQTMDGQSQTATTNTSSDDLMNKEEVLQALTFCAQIDGAVAESITVQAGTFATCRMQITNEAGQPTGSVWLADVAFGIAKYMNTEADGTSIELELQSFRSAR